MGLNHETAPNAPDNALDPSHPSHPDHPHFERRDEHPEHIHHEPTEYHGDHHGERPPAPVLDTVLDFLEWENWTDRTWTGLRDDVLSGLTVCVAQIPQSIAFAVVGKLPPKFGLFSTFYLGLIMAVFGGRSGPIYGAAGALSVAFPSLVKEHGSDAVLASTILCGAICVLPGLFRIASIVRLLPTPIMIGFVDGLAVTIFKGMLDNFQDETDTYITGMKAFYSCLIFFITFAVIVLLPLITTAIPSTIIGVIVGTAVEHIFQLGTTTVGDKYASTSSLEAPRVPDISYGDSTERNKVMLEGLIFAFIGGVESLMTTIVLDKANKNTSNMNREMIVYGAANIVNGFFGGMAGCATVGTTILNIVTGGGKRRVAGTISAVMTLIVIFAAGPVVEIIPLAALSGLTTVICIHTFNWHTLYHIFRMPIPDVLIIFTVTIVTIFTDLAIGVAAGLAVALLCLAWTLRHHVTWSLDEDDVLIDPCECPDRKPASVATLRLQGLLFFSSAARFKHEVLGIVHDVAGRGVTDIIMDLKICTVQDFSGIEAIEEIAEALHHTGVRTHLKNADLSEWLMKRARPYFVSCVTTDERACETVTLQLCRAEETLPCGPLPSRCDRKRPGAAVAYPHSTVLPEQPFVEGQAIVATGYTYVPDLGINLPVVLACDEFPLHDEEGEQMADAPAASPRAKDNALRNLNRKRPDGTPTSDTDEDPVLYLAWGDEAAKVPERRKQRALELVRSTWGIKLVPEPEPQCLPRVTKFVFGINVHDEPPHPEDTLADGPTVATEPVEPM